MRRPVLLLLLGLFTVTSAAAEKAFRPGEVRGFLSNLTWPDVQALAPSIVATAASRAPADRMFAGDVWYGALALLAKYKVEEGIPLCLWMNDMQTGQPETFLVLTKAYRGAAKESLPALRACQAYWPEWGTAFERSHWWTNMGKLFSTTIDAIANDPVPPQLNYFKKIDAVSAIPSTITRPASKVVLRCSASDLAMGRLSYSCRKVQGEAAVSFEPNNSSDASNCTATFTAPGTYVLRVTVVNKTVLDPATWNRSSCIGWRDFKNYDRVLGAVYAEVTVKVLPAR